jgi:hypothetical protein
MGLWLINFMLPQVDRLYCTARRGLHLKRSFRQSATALVISLLLSIECSSSPVPYRGENISQEEFLRYGPIVPYKRIDFHHERVGALYNRRVGGEEAVVCPRDDADGVSLLTDSYHVPRLAFAKLSTPPDTSRRFAVETQMPLALDRIDDYAFAFENTLGRVRGLGHPGEIFPTFSSIHGYLVFQPTGQALAMSRRLRTGAGGVLPNSEKAASIEVTYRLVTRWSEPLAERLLYVGRVSLLPLLMRQHREARTREGEVKALAIAYVLNTYNERAWSPALVELRAEVGNSPKYVITGRTVDEEALELARLIAERRRTTESKIEEGWANELATGKFGPMTFDDRVALAAWGYAGPAFAAGETLLKGGEGIGRDPAQAAAFFQFAAARSMPVAQHNLATCYRDGVGKSRDPRLAFFWYRQASLLGFSMSQFNLGVCYLKGVGVARDEAEAAAWFSLALEGGATGPSDGELREVRQLVEQVRARNPASIDQRMATLKGEIDAHCTLRAADKPWDVVNEP